MLDRILDSTWLYVGLFVYGAILMWISCEVDDYGLMFWVSIANMVVGATVVVNNVAKDKI